MPSVFVPRESRAGETRVAATPETVDKLVKAGLEVVVETGAGARARRSDDEYRKVGARIVEGGDEEGPVWKPADLVLKVQPPTLEEARRLARGSMLISFVVASSQPDVVQALADGHVTTLAMELVPRISRAQVMDALSSQATVAGYKAVLLAATQLEQLCPLLMTAAGTVRPARCVVFGAGVAGLQAIATARRLGCIVEATDVRLAAKEQVESLGAKFITVPGAEDLEGEGGYARQASEEFLRRQREEVAKRVAEADIVITTAQVPGRRAPVLVSEEMLRAMKPGSVIVDMAVESGGNCALSRAGETVEAHGVTILGPSNLPATVPVDASNLYARNVFALAKLLITKEKTLVLDRDDEVIAGCLMTHEGKVVHAPTAEQLAAQGNSRS